MPRDLSGQVLIAKSLSFLQFLRKLEKCIASLSYWKVIFSNYAYTRWYRISLQIQMLLSFCLFVLFFSCFSWGESDLQPLLLQKTPIPYRPNSILSCWKHIFMSVFLQVFFSDTFSSYEQKDEISTQMSKIHFASSSMSSSYSFFFFNHNSLLCLFPLRERRFLIAMHPLSPAKLSRFLTIESDKDFCRNQLTLAVNCTAVFRLRSLLSIIFSFRSCQFWCSWSFSVNICTFV